jgi:predicted SAM-dependent methyltransferase
MYGIYDAVQRLCVYNYSTLECFKTIHNLFYYLFSNISEYKRNELAKQWMDTMVVKTPSSDAHYAKLVYDWYHSIDKTDVVGYPTNIIDNKTQDIVDLIKPYARKNTVLIDIGSSDCQLAKDISGMLDMKPISVTIPHGHKTKKYQLDICKQIMTIPYKEVGMVQEKVGAILFNHSLHHFTSVASIKAALQQSYRLLEKGGVLLIRDHDSENDMFIDLQHVVLEMKYSTELPIQEYQAHMKKYVASLKTHYFNVAMMKEWCRQIGFTYRKVMKKKTNIKDVCNADIDISNTVYLCFRKQVKTRRV